MKFSRIMVPGIVLAVGGGFAWGLVTRPPVAANLLPSSGASRCLGRVVNLSGGTRGDDALIGRLGSDVINGFRGADSIFGLSGRDRLCGGKGDDHINGGDGKGDRVDGGKGYDVCLDAERYRRCEEIH